MTGHHLRRGSAAAPLDARQVRERILAAVRAEPGLTVGDLQRALQVSQGTLHYHLLRLRAYGEVTCVPSGRRRLVFPASQAREDVDLAAAVARLRGATARRIAEYLTRAAPASIADIAAALGARPRVIYYHVGHLLRAGLVTMTLTPRHRRFAPSLDLVRALERLR